MQSQIKTQFSSPTHAYCTIVDEDFIPQHLFNPQLSKNHIFKEDGTKETLDSLLADEQKLTWLQSLSNGQKNDDLAIDDHSRNFIFLDYNLPGGSFVNSNLEFQTADEISVTALLSFGLKKSIKNSPNLEDFLMLILLCSPTMR